MNSFRMEYIKKTPNLSICMNILYLENVSFFPIPTKFHVLQFNRLW